jgi:hypothetical protein
MIYLKTIFSAPNEIKYLKLNLAESFNHIDKFVICEFNRTHTGEDRELVFEKYWDEFTQQEKDKIIYIGADISKYANYAVDKQKQANINARVIRGYFASQIDLDKDDIIFSVDADEIILEQYYEEIIKELEKMKWPWQKKSLVLKLRQFYYRANYLWENNEFIAPIACRASCYKNKYPNDWRYTGKLYNKFVGCHFSWILTIDEMIKKLNMYSHQSTYAKFAKRDILEDAVKNKKYPFDPDVDFKIRVLDIYKDKEYYPRSLYSMLDKFKDFII